MSQFTKKFKAEMSKIRGRDLIYPGILLIFLSIVGFVFFNVATFLTKSINNAFTAETKKTSGTLNIENYTIVAKKLGISIARKEEPAPIITTTVVATTTEETSVVKAPTDTDEPKVLDKKSLTLNILNSTPINGSAGILASLLEAAGLAKAVTGNEKKPFATTTIFIKESKGDFTQLLLEEVRKTYPDALAATTEESALFDATIIIGSK